MFDRRVGDTQVRRGWGMAIPPGICLVAALLLAPAAMAQSTSTPTAFPEGPGDWAGSVTLGGQIQSGQTKTRGYSLDGSFAYMNGRKQTFRLDLSGDYAQFRSLGTDEELETVEDRRQLSLTFLHPFNERFSFVEVGQYQHDLSRALDHRTMLSTGIAWHAIETSRVQLLIIPGITLGEQSSDLAHAPDSITAFGAYQMLRINITPTISFDESVIAFQDFDVDEFRSVVLSSAITAAITTHLGLSVIWDYTYEGIRPEGAPASQRTLTVGLRFSL